MQEEEQVRAEKDHSQLNSIDFSYSNKKILYLSEPAQNLVRHLLSERPEYGGVIISKK